jgi:AraC-like DNA-binding protein
MASDNSNFCTVIAQQPHFTVEKIVINGMVIHYVKSHLPVEISYVEIAQHWYQFTIKFSDASVFHLESQCALLIDCKSLSIQHSDINAVFIHFDEKKLQQYLKKRYGKCDPSIPWVAVIDSKVLLHSLVLWAIHQYNDLMVQADVESWAPIENALLELIVDNLDRRQSIRSEDYEIKRNWFTELEAWMEQNLDNTITLNDLASVAGVSVRSIQKAFRQYRQCTPMDALMQKRLEKARAILLSPTESTTVLEVAMTLGYLHPSRFAKQYKEKFGEKPSETLAKSRNGYSEKTI